jgi:organic hydroperoxide reductase OsmC/OhrA
MNNAHHYAVSLEWTGNRGTGTSAYRAYGRDHVVSVEGKKHDIQGSSDRVFFGDRDRWNPEDLLLSALSQCHMLSYLHVATNHGVVVVAYTDEATGVMTETGNGGGHFTSVTLRPRVTVLEEGMLETARAIHREAAEKCFIAASVNFPVAHEPETFVLV